MIYLLHIVIIFLIFILIKKIKYKYFAIYLYTIIIFGQRWLVGTDYVGYMRLFLAQKGYGLYFFLQEFIFKNKLTFQLLIIIVLMITMFNFLFFLYKYTKRNQWVLLIFCFSEMYFQQFSQIRQYMAISFFLISILCLINKKRLYFVLFYLIAFNIHMSVSIVVLPLIIFYFWEMKKYQNQIIVCILPILPFINFSFLAIKFGGHYGEYGDTVFSTHLSNFNLIAYYSILFFYITYRYNKDDSQNNKFFLLYLILYGISFKFAIMIRASFYFKIFAATFLVNYIGNNRFFVKKLSAQLVVFYCAFSFIGLVYTNPYRIQPFYWKPLIIYEKKNYLDIRVAYMRILRGVKLN